MQFQTSQFMTSQITSVQDDGQDDSSDRGSEAGQHQKETLVSKNRKKAMHKGVGNTKEEKMQDKVWNEFAIQTLGLKSTDGLTKTQFLKQRCVECACHV